MGGRAVRHPPDLHKKYQREIERKQRKARLSSSRTDFKECANGRGESIFKDSRRTECPYAGQVLGIENFRTYAGGRIDSYCVTCRSMITRQWKMDNEHKLREKIDRDLADGLDPTLNVRAQKARNKREIDKVSGVRWCKTHVKPRLTLRQCGCGGFRDIKPKKWREAMSRRMRGRKRTWKSPGNTGKTFSFEHRMRIGASVKAARERRLAAASEGGSTTVIRATRGRRTIGGEQKETHKKRVSKRKSG